MAVDRKKQRSKNKLFRDVAQWLAYQSGGLGAGGSSPPIPIIYNHVLFFISKTIKHIMLILFFYQF